MSNNAEGDKRVIFSGITWYYGDTDSSCKPGISLHVPLPMNVANARYHSLLGDNIFQFWFTLRVSTASFKRLGKEGLRTKPKAEQH